jgi:uncharacterized protein YbaR (Trm112 family)
LISKELLNILACPNCKSNLRYDKEKNQLICEKCSLVYMIIDDIPILLVEEAKPLEKEDER